MGLFVIYLQQFFANSLNTNQIQRGVCSKERAVNFYASKESRGDCLDPINLFYTGVLVGIYCWRKAKGIKEEGD